jgi:DNA-binding MarR family transcriptional regulator
VATGPIGDDEPSVEQQVAGSLSPEQVAAEIRGTLAVLYHRIRQTKETGDLTLSESSAVSRLQHGGPTTAATLAKLEQISPQSIGATVASLEARGLIQRSADPADGRRVILSVTSVGDAPVEARRSVRDQQFTRALGALSADERAQLLRVMPILARLADEL